MATTVGGEFFASFPQSAGSFLAAIREYCSTGCGFLRTHRFWVQFTGDSLTMAGDVLLAITTVID